MIVVVVVVAVGVPREKIDFCSFASLATIIHMHRCRNCRKWTNLWAVVANIAAEKGRIPGPDSTNWK